MSEFLSSLTGGIARFALAWLLPTAAAVGLFWAFCVPALAHDQALSLVTGATLIHSASAGSQAMPIAHRDPVAALGMAAFLTFALSILLAYGSQLIYRILEGYHLPRSIDRQLTNHQRRRYQRLVATRDALANLPGGLHSKRYGLVAEQIGLYPVAADRTMPTRLGNALRSLEGYGQQRYALDSQQFWYELIGTVDPPVRRDTEETRSLVDLFVAAVAVAALLAAVSAGVALRVNQRAAPLALALMSALFVPVAYRGAVRNMKDWHNSVRALVNIGRISAAHAMGLAIPKEIEEERKMWRAASAVLMYGNESDGWRPWLDFFRRELPVGPDRRPTVEPAGTEPPKGESAEVP